MNDARPELGPRKVLIVNGELAGHTTKLFRHSLGYSVGFITFTVVKAQLNKEQSKYACWADMFFMNYHAFRQIGSDIQSKTPPQRPRSGVNKPAHT